jgi:Zn-dependent protease
VNVPEQMLTLPLWYAVFLLSLTCHEAAHALVAWKGGDPTAYLGGQVTLNPIPHVLREPLGTILFPLITFFSQGWMMGWASAPYDPSWEGRHPRRAAVMAVAGPMANLVLAALAFAVLKAGLSSGTWTLAVGDQFAADRLVLPASEAAASMDGLGRLFSVMLVLNLVLFLFNLIPLPPMDGSSVLAGFVEPLQQVRDWLRGAPLAALLGLLVAWTVFPYLFRPVFLWVWSYLAA